MNNDELLQRAREIRRHALTMCYESQTSHIGCALSCADILAALYFDVLRVDPARPEDPERDRFILSKGHGVVALYAALGERGYFSKRRFDDYCRDGSELASHVGRHALPGAETSGGSGGHGLSLGCGMALAIRNQGLAARVVVLSGDGEMEEGSVWEALMFASSHKLSNLTLVVDHNHLQDGTDGLRVEEILDLSPIDAKLRAFGWSVEVADGHDFTQLTAALRCRTDTPHAVVAHTIKGKGVRFMENDGIWHGKVMNREHYERALAELGEPAHAV